MEKGICFYFGFKSNPKQRTKLIKDAGLTCVIANADKKFNNQNGSIKKQIKYFKTNKLKLSSLHMRYNSKDLPFFWEDCKLGNKLEKNLIKDVKLAKKYGFTCVVVHLRGTPDEIGYNRLRRILKVCEKVKIPLAIENINKKEAFIKTFENVKSGYLKFCYDAGHGNCFDTDYDYLNAYLDKLICLHLHSNNGKSDQHTLNKYGNINWEKLAKTLAKCPNELNLDYEVLMLYRENETEEEVLKEVKKQADELEKLIEKFKAN